MEASLQRYRECLAHQTLKTGLENIVQSLLTLAGKCSGWFTVSFLVSFNHTWSLSPVNHYTGPKKRPERSHRFLKPSARVKIWGLVDLTKLTPHSSLTNKKHRWRIICARYLCWPRPCLLCELQGITVLPGKKRTKKKPKQKKNQTNKTTATTKKNQIKQVFPLKEIRSLLIAYKPMMKVKNLFKYSPEEERISAWTRYLWTWNPACWKQWFSNPSFCKTAELWLSGTEAYLPSHSSNPLAWPLLQPQFQTTLHYPCTSCTETNPQGDQAVLLPLVILRFNHQKRAKNLPRRASKEQNHYLITINLNKNGL